MASQTSNATQNVQNNLDPSSAYYIHPSDASTMQLVSVKFDGNGFHNWKRSMILTLSAKNKIGFVNGTIPVPISTDAEYRHWERCNSLVISWLLFNLEPGIAKSVLFMQTAKEIWDDLEERFGYASMTQIYSLEQQLLELKQGNDSISEFFTKIKTIWDGINDANPLPHCTCKLCTCNLTQRIQNRQQEQRMLQFMMKLSDEFAAVRGNILMMQPIPNVSQAYRLFAQEERHKELSQLTSQTEAMAFYADRKRFNGQGQRSFNNYQKQNAENTTGNSFTRMTKPASKYYCTHCKIAGHSIERCFKVHGYPPGFQAKQERKLAAYSQHYKDGENSENQFASDGCNNASTSGDHHVTQAQYHQLMNLLQKQNSHYTEKDSNDDSNTAKHALLAGPFSEQASDSSW